MGGESHSSSSSSLETADGSRSRSSMGSQSELINIRGAQLYLIDGEETVLMTAGGFSLKLLKQSSSPLAVVVANVGEVQWPVGKDAPVLKVWQRRYTFALPGLVYGLIFPDSTPTAVLQHLEAILAEYTTFETHHEIADAVQYLATSGGVKDNPGFWTAVAPEVETLSSRVARNIDSTSTIVASSIVMGGDWAALGVKHGANWVKHRKVTITPASGDSGVSPRMMKRMQQARRMSAVAKLMSRTLLKGAISATGHVSKNLGLDSTTQVDTGRNVAVASVDAFGKVVEAVETAGKSLYDVTQRVGTDIVQERFGADASQMVSDSFGAVGNVINTAWTLNKVGIKMLLKMTAASTALSARSATQSTVTTDHLNQTSPSISTGTMPPELQREISLSTQQVPLSTQQSLQTSQLFPTAAEQMRMNITSTAPPSHSPPVYIPTSRSNSPFQQYHWSSPFTFQPAQGTNMQTE